MPPEERVSTERPVILGETLAPESFKRHTRGGERSYFADPVSRDRRVQQQFEEASAALSDQLQLSDSIHTADPQLVLIFEALDEQIDLTGVAQKLGIEILVQAEDSVEPTSEYKLNSKKATKPYIGSCLHAVFTNKASFDKLISHWRKWNTSTSYTWGYAPLTELFKHLKDVRPWGPQDRLRGINWEEYFAGLIDDRLHSIEIELWYRRSVEARETSQRDITNLVERAGGSVTRTAVIAEIGYHGVKCSVPTQVLRNLAAGEYEAVELIKSANVMYFRVSGQSLPVHGSVTSLEGPLEQPLPSGDPVLCLLDGVPATNHPLLAGRVVVHDPDELSDRATVDERRHGTAMTSVAVWGDRGAEEPPASRPVLVRPILTPSSDTADRIEELPADELTPDLMWRVFRELFEGTPTQPAAGANVAIINLSVGDPVSPFDTIMSSWSRMLDWLSYEYGVLVIISAGNHKVLHLQPSHSSEISGLQGADRRQAVLEAMNRQRNSRRILAPAESVNALSVGAIHADASIQEPRGYVFDPMDGLPAISPVSPTGSGYRQSVKPEVAANGGRVFFRDGITSQNSISFTEAKALGPGIKTAAPASAGETHVAGTSPAAALLSRRAARLNDVVQQITQGTAVNRRQRASAIKALLVHGASPSEVSLHHPLPAEMTLGNGDASRDYAEGCSSNEAVLLYFGQLGADEQQELLFPLPDGLNVTEIKRLSATLAWLSPVNWRHRQYRKAALSFVKPAGAIPSLSTPIGLSTDASKRGASTVQHQSWELRSAFASGQGSNMRVRVKCQGQAGGIGQDRIDFAVALSLWVAPELNVDVYNQVRNQVQTRVGIRSQ